MSSFNKVILMGNLTRDPEIRYTQSNMAICKGGLALNRRYKDANGQYVDAVDFVDFTVFGKRAEAFEKYHKKGATAFLEGELRLDTWDDKDTGVKRQKLYVVVNSWEFCGTKQDSQSAGHTSGYGGGGGEYGGAPE